MSRLHRNLGDWRFWTAMAGTLLVVWLVVSTAQAFKAKDEQIDALIQDGRETRAEAALARRQASTERDRLLAQQKRVTRRLDNLVDYLTAQGIALPQNLNRSPSPRSDRSQSSPPANKERPRAADAGQPQSVPGEQTPRPPSQPGRPPQAPTPPAPPPEPGNPVQDLLDQLLGRIAP